MRPLRGLQETRVATREESGVLGFPSRRGLTPRGSLECNPEIPAFPGEEYEVPDTRLGVILVSSVLIFMILGSQGLFTWHIYCIVSSGEQTAKFTISWAIFILWH